MIRAVVVAGALVLATLAGGGAAAAPIAPGSVSVTASSAPIDGRVAFVVTNTSDRTVRVRRVTAVATSSSGTQAARATTDDVVPARLAPGTQAIGSVRFRAGTIELDATFTWKVRVGDVTRRTPVPLATSNPQLSAPMTGAVAQTLTLDVSNQQPQAVAAPVSVRVLCRNEAGLPVQLAARDVRERLGPATSVSVTVRFRSLCPDYVVAAQGTPAR